MNWEEFLDLLGKAADPPEPKFKSKLKTLKAKSPEELEAEKEAEKEAQLAYQKTKAEEMKKSFVPMLVSLSGLKLAFFNAMKSGKVPYVAQFRFFPDPFNKTQNTIPHFQVKIFPGLDYASFSIDPESVTGVFVTEWAVGKPKDSYSFGKTGELYYTVNPDKSPEWGTFWGWIRWLIHSGSFSKPVAHFITCDGNYDGYNPDSLTAHKPEPEPEPEYDDDWEKD